VENVIHNLNDEPQAIDVNHMISFALTTIAATFS